MANDHHTLLDGRVHVYKRKNSRFWQCAIYLGAAITAPRRAQTGLPQL